MELTVILIVLLFVGGGALVISSVMQVILARRHWVLGLILPAVDLIAVPVTVLVLRMLIGIGFGRTAFVSCIVWMIPLIVHLIILAVCRNFVRNKQKSDAERRKRELDQMQIQDL